MPSIEEKIIGKDLKNLDECLTTWMAKSGLKILRIGPGIIFFWFGMLKFFYEIN